MERSAYLATGWRLGRYLSARWPGDAYLFARRFSEMLAVSNGGGGLPGR